MPAHTAGMNLALLLSAVLCSAIYPTTLPASYWAEKSLSVTVGEYLFVASVPSDVPSHEERGRALRERAEDVASVTGREVCLTDDLLTYLCLKRILKRGADDYERHVLASRLSRAGERIVFSSPEQAVS